MAFNVRLMLNEIMPLRRIQVRYPKSRTSINNIYDRTDNDGRVRIERDDDPRGVEVEVYANNPVVGAVSGALNAQVSVMTRLHADEEMIVPRKAKDRDNFRMVEVARDIYNRTCRHFSPFTAEFPFPNVGENLTRQIRIKLDSPSSTSFTDPHAPQFDYPLIHIKENQVRLADGTLDFGGQLRRHISSELAHALHFGTMNGAKRRAVRLRYLATLISSGVLDGFDFSWSDGDPDARLMAFVEAFDLFVDHFDQTLAIGTNYNVRRASFNADEIASIVTATGAATGPRTPGAVCLALFRDYAGAPGIGLKTAVTHYVTSGSLTFPDFRRWVRRNFGENSVEFAAIDAAATAGGM
ncbi:MAG: hypothetical protein ACKVSF_01990 [Alphaproteobacteria bacterium]